MLRWNSNIHMAMLRLKAQVGRTFFSFIIISKQKIISRAPVQIRLRAPNVKYVRHLHTIRAPNGRTAVGRTKPISIPHTDFSDNYSHLS